METFTWYWIAAWYLLNGTTKRKGNKDPDLSYVQ